MNPVPVVSIIINNFNHSRFVGEAIESALAQTHPYTEVIIVDDGSTDGSRRVIKRFADRVRMIFKENSGQGSAINVGYEVCSGDFIIFLDSDDLLCPDAASQVAEVLEDETVSKVTWQLKVIDEYGQRTGTLKPPIPPSQGSLRRASIKRGPMSFTVAPTSGNAWPRRFLKCVMPIPPDDFTRGADAYLLALSPIYGLSRRLESSMSYYRIHGGNFLASQSEFDKRKIFQRRTEAWRQALESHLLLQGVVASKAGWGMPYLDRLERLELALLQHIPPHASFILVDEDMFNLRNELDGRARRHLIERDGKYWGPPSSDAMVITEIENRRAEGVGFLAFAWPALWWLKHYQRMCLHLDSHYQRLVDSDHVTLFDLNARESRDK